MQLPASAPVAVTVELDATDCLILADALATATRDDACPDQRLVNALRTALEACAALVATGHPARQPDARGGDAGGHAARLGTARYAACRTVTDDTATALVVR